MFSYSLKGFSEPAYKNCLCKLYPTNLPYNPQTAIIPFLNAMEFFPNT